MTISSTTALRRLHQLRYTFDADTVSHKQRMLQVLEKGSLRSGDEVARLHDVLCFMRAYPDNAAVLGRVERMLGEFGNRKDLTRHHHALADTGITGTTIDYRFYWPTARWLFERWPGALSIRWREWNNRDNLDELWPLLLSYPAIEALESLTLSPRQWINTLKRPQETDAAFLIRHFIRWQVEETVREKFYDDLDVPLRLAAYSSTPSRTHSKYKSAKVSFAHTPLESAIRIPQHIQRKPVSMHSVSGRRGNQLIDLARVQMVTRERDLYAFMNADPKDVRIVTYEEGLQFVCYGLLPQRRSLLETMYVFLILKNGVPIGYTQATTLLRSAEINFNIFAGFRGTESSRIFVNTLALAHHLFGADAFVINTQQLGEGNQDALKSGAFWFYYKHGFRPRDPDIRGIVRTERAHKKAQPGYRCRISTMRKLAGGDIYLFLNRPRSDLVNTIATENIGLAAAKVLETQAIGAHSNGARQCMEMVMRLLDYQPANHLSSSCRIAWERWSPIILALPGVYRWSPANKRALIEVINAKGGRRESDFVRLFDQHKLLQSAVLKLSKKSLNEVTLSDQ